jgi:hypothetical protein
MYEITRLKEEIEGHLRSQLVQSHFSSWGACFSIVADFARGHGESAYVAILDTTLLEDHVKIHHVPELCSVGLSRYSYDHEYLAYGPISGDAYFCVPWKHLQAAVLTFMKHVGPVSSDQMAYANQVADLFRREEDKRPDVVIALAVMFLGLGGRPWNVEKDPKGFRADMKTIVDGLADDIKAYTLPDSETGGLGLANPKTFTKRYPLLAQSVRMLLAIEQHLKSIRESSAEKEQSDDEMEIISDID